MLLPWAGLVVLALGGLGVVLSVVPSAVFDLDRFGVPKELILHVTALCLLPLIIVRRRPLALGIADLLLAAFTGWTLVSAVLATNHWVALQALGITMSGLIVFLGARTVAESLGPRPIVVALSVALVLGSATGLAQAYGWSSELLADSRAPGGTFGNRNFMAHAAVIGLPLLAWLFVTTTKRAGSLLWVGALATTSGAMAMSRSRAAWLGATATVLVVLIVGALTRRRGRPRVPRRRLGQLALALLLGVGAALIVPNTLSWRSSTPYRDSVRDVLNYQEGSGRGRLIQYENSLRLVRRDPVFGVGPGNWAVAYPLVTTGDDPSYDPTDPIPTNPWPSSDWVAMLAERGVPGGALAAAALLAFLVIAIRRSRDDDPARGLAALAGAGVIVATVGVGLFDAVLLLAPPTFVVMAAVGGLVPATKPVLVVRRGRLGAMYAGLAVLTALAGFRSTAQLRAILATGTSASRASLEAAARFDPVSYRLQIMLALRSRCPARAEYARRAAKLFPHHPIPARLTRDCGRAPLSLDGSGPPPPTLPAGFRAGTLIIVASRSLALSGAAGQAPPGLARWRPVPTWTFGEGSSASFARIAAAAVDRDGTAFVLDADPPFVRVISAKGRQLRTFGRKGDGPGEFRSPSRIGLQGDTIWVTDPGPRRLTFLDRAGRPLGTMSTARARAVGTGFLGVTPAGPLADGVSPPAQALR